ncbi:hypothetical protein EMIHUDRAFT_250885 [Emiliania huxleyi CCMP1516]|uniref:Btz domain-containing protein n=2 Tax=Emiliania huxleyi TaxID=2903 RepID=A0A0D3KYC2_EMIH1|nr:hypothetical protein EMIHUDRAFT_222531 [Emiliania huxleyi CCMP1516]XP_005793538.1 hypothetical protein EMIHUDRAFT_250885 [Emiliania huxleyi CCMP1516]EOD40757.1 hypothetical protein EMIHUDRAFT_222531 [Emiliania huxleyi CCMP1516]EOD41109.1 hypothetical protein EMIHUDRAFT_250885 [Emiliania huxleyi CCMP1516]|eukprot:XP_005793186.1 hypothetical protein EMIHUDRAFT_222531 [Emiliania huxleyi CCMP1516]
MVTPRFRGARRVGGEDASGGGGSTKGSFVMRDGANGSKPISNWGGNNPDPDFVARHNHLMERQHFGGDYWRSRGVNSAPRPSFYKR